ncbi:MAG TPA: PTS sugar transporter subunit IIA [Mycobacteriales bacterium]|jgi:PTS system ascorbate-specific IIA component|nr:PTS sugar transporter subunit IIA [Mycobacteriales bacterium]
MAVSVEAGTRVTGRVNVHAADWAAAVRAATQLLVTSGAVSERYADRCVNIVREQGPYIVIAPGIALAHARPEDGAHALGLAAVCLAEPVRFGHQTNDPVDVVFAFSSPEPDAHVGLIASLARALADGLADRFRLAATDEAATLLLQGVINDEQQLR